MMKQTMPDYLPWRVVLATMAVFAAIVPAQAHWCGSGARLTNIERAICSDANLIAKDQQLNSLYTSLGGQGNRALKAAQRQWMNSRNGCTSMTCLHTHYNARLNALRAMSGVQAPPPPVYAQPSPPVYRPPSQPSAPDYEPPASASPAPTAPSSTAVEKLPDIKPF